MVVALVKLETRMAAASVLSHQTRHSLFPWDEQCSTPRRHGNTLTPDPSYGPACETTYMTPLSARHTSKNRLHPVIV